MMTDIVSYCVAFGKIEGVCKRVRYITYVIDKIAKELGLILTRANASAYKMNAIYVKNESEIKIDAEIDLLHSTDKALCKIFINAHGGDKRELTELVRMFIDELMRELAIEKKSGEQSSEDGFNSS